MVWNPGFKTMEPPLITVVLSAIGTDKMTYLRALIVELRPSLEQISKMVGSALQMVTPAVKDAKAG